MTTFFLVVVLETEEDAAGRLGGIEGAEEDEEEAPAVEGKDEEVAVEDNSGCRSWVDAVVANSESVLAAAPLLFLLIFFWVAAGRLIISFSVPSLLITW